MMTVSVIITVKELQHTFGKTWSYTDVNEYISYTMNPYHQLRIFSFMDFKDLQPPIDGRYNPNELQRQINDLTANQTERINALKSTLFTFHSLEELCNEEAGNELFALLSGKFTKTSILYFTNSHTSFLDTATIRHIYEFPEDYVIAKMNLYH